MINKEISPLHKFFSNCRNPKIILNNQRKRLLVPCGHCSDCANKKSVYYTSMCVNASSEFKYCYMLTLKYDEVNVPRMRLIKKGDLIFCKDITRRFLKNGKFKTFKTYGKIINVFPNDETFDKFYKKADIESKCVKKLPFRNLRWCSKEDFQNFIKRFRFHLSEVSDSTFSYFAVSEYGPQTFRPHFHILLYFNDGRLFSNLYKCALKSWKYGSLRCESPKSKAGVSTYVASYINSYSHLPHYLDSPFTRPRSFHSVKLGSLAIKEIRDYVYQSVGYPFEKTTIDTSFGPRDVILTKKITNILFPRCYNYELQNRQDRRFLYTIYQKLCDYFSTDKLVLLTRYVMSFESYTIRRFRDLLGLSILNFCDNSHVFDKELSDVQITQFNRIYSALLLSKHFMTFVCDNDSYSEVIEKLSMIDDFYNSRDFYLLRLQYRMLEEYSKQYLPDVVFSTIPNLDNHSIFYYNTVDYLEKLNSNPCVVYSRQLKDFHYQEKIKHKELNDANLIFV